VLSKRRRDDGKKHATDRYQQSALFCFTCLKLRVSSLGIHQCCEIKIEIGGFKVS